MNYRRSTRAHADRLLLDLIEAYRSGKETAALRWLADHPADEQRVVAAINRHAGKLWRWGYPSWRRVLDYTNRAALGSPLDRPEYRPLAIHKRRAARVGSTAS